MSKNSAKQRMTQLMEWLPTLSSKRNRPIKANSIRSQQANKQDSQLKFRSIKNM
jgi:hypothetical protein